MRTLWSYLAILLFTASGLRADFAASANLDAIIEKGIEDDLIPGAVLLVCHDGRQIHRKAYGNRSVAPTPEPMTMDTIFDAASLTKVLATAPAIMKLFEEGRIRLNDRVTEYLPEFQGGESRITVRHLLTHFSGLRPDLDLQPPWEGYRTGIDKALIDEPVAEPGERFIYSDINYILLAEIVHQISGKMLPDYAEEHFFRPLEMKETMFLPPEPLIPRIAPTEQLPGRGEPLRGVVHDPTTRYMGGVSGHAGLFTTAGDLARFAEMMVGMGERNGRRVLQPLTVRKMITPQSPANQAVMRGAGWDLDSPYSSNRGELLPLGSYGHTGFTGTSLWIDPVTKTSVILLTNRVHPHYRGSITSLRSRVATAVAAGLGIDLPGISITGYNETLAGSGAPRRIHRTGKVKTGLDVLAAQGFARLKGRRVGLITNHTGLSRDGRRNLDLMIEAGIEVKALFSPEHGVSGTDESGDTDHAIDKKTGVRVWSLYAGENRRPAPEMLEDIDVLIFDIQDAGARFYTYMCTMIYAMEEAARHDVGFVVLDRPNPITGVHVEGPMLDPALESFVGCCQLPIRHGMTLGEIARYARTERKLGLRLEVVRMAGWQRGDWFDSTGLVWVNPSPNIRSLNAALLYPALAMLEYSPEYSVGRGTDSPFEQFGADWIDGAELANLLNLENLPGVRFYPTRFTPATSRFAGKQIEGVRLVITDRDVVDTARLGLEIARALTHLYPGRLHIEANARLIGEHTMTRELEQGAESASIQRRWIEAVKEFLNTRRQYLIY